MMNVFIFFNCLAILLPCIPQMCTLATSYFSSTYAVQAQSWQHIQKILQTNLQTKADAVLSTTKH